MQYEQSTRRIDTTVHMNSLPTDRQYQHNNPNLSRLSNSCVKHKRCLNTFHSNWGSRKGKKQETHVGAGSHSKAKNRVSSPDGWLYHVQFKRTSRYYTIHPSLLPLTKLAPLAKGTMVIVQSERGEDIGIIRDHDTSSSNMLRKPYHTKHILRIAHEDEQHEIHEKVREEEYILDTTRCYAKLFGFRYDNIIDVELQLDRYEITILYVSKEYINYKILIEKLNALYQTRIWFKQMDMDRSIHSMKNDISHVAINCNMQPSTEEEGLWLATIAGLLPSYQERCRILGKEVGIHHVGMITGHHICKSCHIQDQKHHMRLEAAMASENESDVQYQYSLISNSPPQHMFTDAKEFCTLAVPIGDTGPAQTLISDVMDNKIEDELSLYDGTPRYSTQAPEPRGASSHEILYEAKLQPENTRSTTAPLYDKQIINVTDNLIKLSNFQEVSTTTTTSSNNSLFNMVSLQPIIGMDKEAITSNRHVYEPVYKGLFDHVFHTINSMESNNEVTAHSMGG